MIRVFRMLIEFASHGLSYTTFALSNATVSSPQYNGSSLSVDISVEVKNIGDIIGSEVVQLYVSLPPNGTTTPHLQLRGFAKVRDVSPGKSRSVTIKLDKYAFSFWDSPNSEWKVIAGKYILRIGTSSESLPIEHSIELKEGFGWSGL